MFSSRHIRKTYEEIESLRRAVQSNADPKLAVELGALRLQGLKGGFL